MQDYDITSKTISATDLPERLLQLAQVPAALFVKGDAHLLNHSPIVGIVGARKFTPYGKSVTDNIARTLAKARVPIVSGLALGVDSIAHRSCIDGGSPTIAVLPCGIDTVYPASHAGLARQILETGGLLISEYPTRQLPQKHQFIERNRIIAALSDVLIVTEAAERSGSLHTARFALELGKTVMAVPGNITSPFSSGTNRLIQAGATPILDPQDILNELGISNEPAQSYIPENEAEAVILRLLRNGPVTGNELLTASGLAPGVFQTHLTMLEIKGVLQASAGQWLIK